MSRKQKTAKANLEPTIDNSFSLRKITPITDSQKDVFDAFEEGLNLLLCGSAGTGKTYISLYLALSELIKRDRTAKDHPTKIMIVRSTVSSRDIGFLPGTVKEKMAVYEDPYRGIFSELFGRGDAYEILKSKGIIEFCSTSFLRGTTINDTYMIVDEVQNCTYEEIKTVITRVGKNTKIFFCGDLSQNDLYRNRNDTTGLPKFIRILDNMEEFDIVEFGVEDIVRSGIVKSFIIAEEKVDKQLE
jgi:phosphate starvation-inducible protein PhoH and related proteins